jgi:2-polyprenyl-3-methyl-5-hydroxy-6-metoxy-1,4-benzoquinol methylase
MTKLTHISCPICEHQQLHSFLNVSDHSISKESFELVQCGQCSFVFTQHVPEEADAGRYYQSEDYISHSDTTKGLVNRIYHAVRNAMLGKKRKIVRQFAPGKKVLDLGCGTGYFLHHLKSNGFETTGVEVSEDAKKMAIEKFGLDVHSPTAFLDEKLAQDYDAITLWHVLEHLYDLDRYMTAIRDSLKVNGVVIIAVPNKNALDAAYYRDKWAAYDAPRHLWHFTPDTMRALAAKHQLRIVRYKRLPFDPFYNCMLSEKYKGNVLSFFTGGVVGFFSHLNSLFNMEKSSSMIYILKKNNA